jgi:hypothetical protein
MPHIADISKEERLERQDSIVDVGKKSLQEPAFSNRSLAKLSYNENITNRKNQIDWLQRTST